MCNNLTYANVKAQCLLSAVKECPKVNFKFNPVFEQCGVCMITSTLKLVLFISLYFNKPARGPVSSYTVMTGT